jgi:hypothetical protein
LLRGIFVRNKPYAHSLLTIQHAIN